MCGRTCLNPGCPEYRKQEFSAMHLNTALLKKNPVAKPLYNRQDLTYTEMLKFFLIFKTISPEVSSHVVNS